MKTRYLLTVVLALLVPLTLAGCAIESGGNDDKDAGMDVDGQHGTDRGADVGQADEGPGCDDECQAEETSCADNGVRECGYFDEDSCLEWSEPATCAFNENCEAGACVVFCEDDCTADSRQCADLTTFEVCGEYDDDPCLDWGDATACEIGYNCDEGQCVIGCEDACQEGTLQCEGRGYDLCGNHDEDPCLEWGAHVDCDPEDACSEGACVCVDECELGTGRCVPGGLKACDDHDDDPCAEWTEPAPCEDQMRCTMGECVCDHQCQEGQLRCTHDGMEGLESCGDSDGNTCREWGDPTACPDGLFCEDWTAMCQKPYPEEPHGTQLGDTMANDCYEECICDNPDVPEGRRFCMSELVDTKATLISVHTGWCPSCATQTVAMEPLYQAYKDDGLMIMLIQYEDAAYRRDRASLLTLGCDEKIGFGLTFMEVIDAKAEMTEKYFDAGYIPLNMIVDKNMVIRYKYEGYDPDSIEATIVQLLAE